MRITLSPLGSLPLKFQHCVFVRTSLFSSRKRILGEYYQTSQLPLVITQSQKKDDNKEHQHFLLFSLFFILVNQSIVTLRSIFHNSQIRTRFKPCSFHFIFTSYVGFHKEKQQNLIADNLLAPLTTTLLQPMIQEDTLRWTVFCLPRMRSSFHP